MSTQELETLGREAARRLKVVLPLVRGDRKEENTALFEKLDTEPPPMHDESWGRMAFVAGLYSNFMGRQELSDGQRSSLWLALSWAVRYESAKRPNMLRARAKQLFEFIKMSPRSPEAIALIADVIEHITPAMDRKTLEWLLRETSSLAVPAITAAIEVSIESRPVEPTSAASATDSGDGATLSRLWHYLDRKLEALNLSALEKVKTDAATPAAKEAVAKLGGIILRSMLARFLLGTSELPDADLELALGISRNVVAYSEGSFKTNSNVDALILRAIRDSRRARLDREAFLAVFESVANDDAGWNKLAACVSLEFSKQEAREQTREIFGDWLRIFKGHWAKLERRRQADLLTEARRHTPDSILLGDLQPTEEQLALEAPAEAIPGMSQLLSAYKRLDLPEIGRILVASRPHLISELCRKLSSTNPDFQSILPPRRFIKMWGPSRGGKSVDMFPEASRLVYSPDDASKKRGLEMFEQYAGAKIHPDFKPLAREWMLYAQAQYRGLPAVFADWQRDLKGKTASWEEIWNLAVFYLRIGDTAAALEVLRPGTESFAAPYSHLRFALYCALQIVEVPTKVDAATAAGQRFLIQNLQLHPLPECFLMWVLLVDEAAMNVLPQQRFQVLATFQQLVEEPVRLLDPDAEHPDNILDAFRKRLDELHLDKTWLIWVNDFAIRRPFKAGGYRRLSEALIGVRRDVDGAVQRAADALQRVVEIQADFLQKRDKTKNPRREGDAPSSASDQLERYLRVSLRQLFEFFKNYLSGNERTTAYKYYSTRYPFKQFWDATDPLNNAIITLTRDLIDPGPPPPPPPPGGGTGDHNDAYILSALAAVKDVSGLRGLQERLFAWVDARVQGATVVRQRRDWIKALVADIGALSSKSWPKAALQVEIKRVNRDLAKAGEHVSQTRELRPLQQVVGAAQTAFAAFAESVTMQPIVRASVLMPGVPSSAPETSLVLDLENVGPGDVADVSIVCEDGDALVTRDAARVPSLPEGDHMTVAVPVTVVGSGPTINCRVHIRYDAGVLKDLRVEQHVSVPVFDFGARLSRVRPGAYEIPIPYTEKPIDFERDDPRLFQGRETYIDQAVSIINGQLKTDPIYYHGVRKVGKSSLLGRLAMEFKRQGVMPLLIKLEGIRASQQDTHLVINTFTTKVVEALRANGWEGELEPIGMREDNPVVALIRFFRSLRGALGQGQVALMIDEFPNLVAPSSSPILDVLRMVHQELSVLLFMSGWDRPRKLESDCPDTQLFPLAYRAIDFLSLEAVARVLREPLTDLEIEVPEATAVRAFELTAGNPHHLAALAIIALGRLNAEQRVCIAPEDLEYGAEEVVQGDRYFRTTIFSQLVLNRSERDGAIAFAKLLKGRRAVGIPEASQGIPTDVLDDLREKGIVQVYPDQQVGIRGVLLSRYLATRIGDEPPDVPESVGDRRVGVFVDVENVREPLAGMSWDEAGKAMVRYAAQFGTVVCRWATFDKANFVDPTGVRIGLERGGQFLVRHPERVRTEENRKDRADFVLIERIHDELTHSKPEAVVLFSGDHGYYEVVSSLIGKDVTVRLVSSADSLSDDYRSLEAEVALRRKIDGLEGDRFKVDTNLAGIFADTASS